MEDINNAFINAIFGKTTAKKILVRFAGYDYDAEFTMKMFDLLATDKSTEYIIDGETGELLYMKG